MKRNKRDVRRWVKLTVGFVTLLVISADAAYLGEAAAAEREAVAERVAESDPWEPFNSKTFWFNHDVLDRYVLKPVAQAWNFVLPDAVQRSLRNAIDNTNMPSRLVNSLAQGKFVGAGQEVARFTINSTVGFGGLLDFAKDGFGIEKSDEDTGQTLGFYGVIPGPYLVLPFLPATDVRDGLGSVVDAAMNPLNSTISSHLPQERTGRPLSAHLQVSPSPTQSTADRSIWRLTKGSRRPWLISTVRCVMAISRNEKR